MTAEPGIRWIVRRHGGRRSDKWRVLYSGQDLIHARRVYERYSDSIRQGAVTIEADRSRVIEETCAPRLRSRW